MAILYAYTLLVKHLGETGTVRYCVTLRIGWFSVQIPLMLSALILHKIFDTNVIN